MIEVLVVDDSAVVRQTLKELLERTGEFSVSLAADPFIAERRIALKRPHVIVLDIEMPGMDGLTFLTRLMATDPLPVVICSARAGEDAAVAIEALARGAIDVLPKPRLGVKDFLSDTSMLLVDTVRAAAQSKRAAAAIRPFRAPVTEIPRGVAATWAVAIGASTGGTEALAIVLGALPRDSPAVLVVQHMPEGFTKAFAGRLNGLSAMQVKEAEDGDPIRQGEVLLAPGNRHLSVARDGARLVARVDLAPHVNRHRPSVDVLFRSVSETFGSRSVGVLLTGMGKDGAAGLLEMKIRGAQTIAQDETTSIVFGMPKEAIALGAASRILPLQNIGPGILDLLPRA
ncbi:MAG TPA: chemotaxis response regulator protein-glutamate methylesterase [Vicinamibacteria bacterium]|nr:chemotaxis response regulator protein-glutamate methylesterase [Vicinamibacteria bacterium]